MSSSDRPDSVRLPDFEQMLSPGQALQQEQRQRPEPGENSVLLPDFSEMLSMQGRQTPAPRQGTPQEADDPQRVLLPDFSGLLEQQAAGAGAETPESEENPPSGGDAPKAAAAKPLSAVQDEIARTEQLCAGMRREAIEQARQTREQAAQEAVAIRHHARREIEAQLRQENEARLAGLQQTVEAAAAALSEAVNGLYEALEPRLLDTALRIAENILQYELDRDSKAYRAIVHNVLDQDYQAKALVLHLPPGRYDALTGGEAEFSEAMRMRGVEVARDPALDETDCMVTSNMGSIRGGVKTQLSRIRSAVQNQQRGEEQP